VCVINC